MRHTPPDIPRPARRRRGVATKPALLALGSLAALAVLVGLIYALSASQRTRVGGGTTLRGYCAAGIRPPLDELAKQYEAAYGVRVEFVPGNSGSLLGQIEIRGAGDLYIPADISYVELGREKGLLAEALPVARQTVALAVAPGNPKGIAGVADVLRDDVDFMIAEPRAGVGKMTKAAMEALGLWDDVLAGARSQKGTVNEVALDVQSGAVDAGFVWDSTARQYGLDIVPIAALEPYEVTVSAAVLGASTQPAEAFRFARYVASPEHGNAVFADLHYQPVPGDAWAAGPKLTLFSGTVSKPAIEQTLAEFEQRFGVEITTAYHGCGTLIGMMKTGQAPDAYLACDISYVPPAGLDFAEPVIVSTMDLVILVRAGNPRNIHGIEDLAQPGLRIGLADPVTTALGGVTAQMLKQAGVYERAQANLKTQNGGGDLLVSQMVGGDSLDAVIVYRTNARLVGDGFERVGLADPGARAVQPFWARKGTAYPDLTHRLLETLRSARSKERYEATGFEFAGEAP